MGDPGPTFQDVREILADMALEKGALVKQLRAALARIAELEAASSPEPGEATP
jgi:hypothetical protein